MKLYILFYENHDDYYSHPGFVGVFSSKEKAEQKIQDIKKDEEEKVSVQNSFYQTEEYKQIQIEALKKSLNYYKECFIVIPTFGGNDEYFCSGRITELENEIKNGVPIRVDEVDKDVMNDENYSIDEVELDDL